MIKTVSCSIAFLCLFTSRSFAGQPPDTVKREVSTSMDISEYVDQPDDLETFIDSNFVTVKYDGFENPMYPFKVNFINRTDSLKFCAMNVQQCWVQRIDTFYSFFMIIKRTAVIKKRITSVFGNCSISASVTAEGIHIDDSLFIWSSGHINIDQNKYYNISRNPKFEECELIIFGNMRFKQLLLERLK